MALTRIYGNLISSATLTGNIFQAQTITGASIAANTIGSSNLTITGVASGTYGGSTQIPVITVGTDGRVTYSANVSSGGPTQPPTPYTANGVVYAANTTTLNTSSALTFNGTTVTTPRLAFSGTTLPSPGTATIFSRSSDSNFYFQSGSGNTVYLLDGSQNTMYTASPTSHLWAISNATKMALDSKGNLGVGTTSPSKNVDISYSSTSTDPTVAACLQLVNRENSVGYFSGGINFCRIDSTSPMAYMASFQSSTIGNSANGLQWGTKNGTSTVDERMRLTPSGFLLATNQGSYPDGNDVPYHYFNSNNYTAGAGEKVMQIRADSSSFAGYGALTVIVNRNSTNSSFRTLRCSNGNGSGLFDIHDSGNAYNTNNSYGSSSDIKLKENIVDTAPKLADLMRLRVRNYNLKIKPDEKHIGLIAQEAETVFPGLIDESIDYHDITTTDENGKEITQNVPSGTTTKGIKYSVFVPMLIKAMQEQQTIIESLTERIAALEAK
jgi:hypothetical protein